MHKAFQKIFCSKCTVLRRRKGDHKNSCSEVYGTKLTHWNIYQEVCYIIWILLTVVQPIQPFFKKVISCFELKFYTYKIYKEFIYLFIFCSFIEDIMKEFQIKPAQVLSVVSDNASNMVCGIKKLEDYLHLTLVRWL